MHTDSLLRVHTQEHAARLTDLGHLATRASRAEGTARPARGPVGRSLAERLSAAVSVVVALVVAGAVAGRRAVAPAVAGPDVACCAA